MENIVVKNLNLRYGDHVVLDNFRETFNAGELYVIVGRSGSGKTSLLKIIAGLAFMVDGIVEMEGKNIYKMPKHDLLKLHRNSGYVFQNAALVSNLSIYENLSLYYHFHTKMTDDEIMAKLQPFIDEIGFTDDINLRPANLSTGERVMVGIIRAISHDPDYVFFDEPTANLDTYSSQKIRDTLIKLKSQNKTMIMITNDMNFGLSVADRIGILHDGKIIDCGTPDEIRASKEEITQQLLLVE